MRKNNKNTFEVWGILFFDVLEATRKRFRPIVMTTLLTVVGMLPIVLTQGAGAEWKNGIAWVIIGGLISSIKKKAVSSKKSCNFTTRDLSLIL